MGKTCGFDRTQLEKNVLTIEGMNYRHCKSTVEKAVRGLPGVMAGEVSFEDAGFSVV